MNGKQKRYAKKLLVLCILFSLTLTTCGAGFSLKNRNVAEPENPLLEQLEDDKQILTSDLDEMLPQSKELQQEREKKQDQDPEESNDNKDNDGEGKDKKNGPGGNDEENIKEGDQEGNNWFTTTITDGEIVTTESFEFEVIQLQTEIPVVDQQIYLNGEISPGIQGKGIVTLSKGENTIKVTCTYEKESGEQFSISRSYTVFLEMDKIIIYTDLQDDITLSKSAYDFTVYAKYNGVDVPIIVTFNGSICSSSGDNAYSVKLKEGKNTFKVLASLGNMKEEATYKVTFDKSLAVIVTDLDDRDLEVEKAGFSFYASLMQGDETQKKLKVKFNGKTIDDTSDYEYHVTLKEGINTIVLDPTETNPDLDAQTYEVAYYAPANGLEVRTDLEDGWETQNASFTFLAYALSDKGEAELTVKLEKTKVKPGKNNYYQVRLSEGENIIYLHADDGTEELNYSFSIYYNPIGKDNPMDGDDVDQPGKDDNKDDKKEDEAYYPTLKTTLVEGKTIVGQYLNFDAWAYDYLGNSLESENILVKGNGSRKKISLIYERDGRITYKAQLDDGENKITFTVVDNEGNSADFQYTIYAKHVKEGEPIGQVTISVFAPVLDIGYIVAPKKVDIFEGDSAATVLKRALESESYECIFDGGYFLGVGNLNIEGGQLCGGDFGSSSGWMYGVNGDIPNYGMTGAYMQDGDEVRVKYSMNGGKDFSW